MFEPARPRRAPARPRRPARSRLHGLSAPALLLVLASSGRAQSAAPPSYSLSYPYDSGWLTAPTQPEAVVASTTVRVSGAPWIRLEFQGALLPDGTRLWLTSISDGAVQELDAAAAREWRLTSAYFNGDAVQLDVVSSAGAAPARVALRAVWIGPLTPVQYTVCGATDDRVLSSDPRVARLLPVGCTGWIFDDAAHCMSTAGHCAGTLLQVAEFNVPLSSSAGAILHPPPEDQYAVDPASVQRENAGVGADWGYFGCFANSNTGLTPYQRQQGAFALAAPTAPGSTALRVTGHGVDYDTPSASYAQQTHAGPYVSLLSHVVQHLADTTGGSSGSPLELDDGSGRVIGVHTHGGCPTSGSGANNGTAADLPAWAAARAQPAGVCNPTSSVTPYCTPKMNSLGCIPTITSTGTPSASGGPGSFVLHVDQLLNRRLGFFMYSPLPKSAPFNGGVLCVAPPRRRTTQSNSGGTAVGNDCSGHLDYDLGARIAAGVDAALSYGSIVYVQCWSRDPADPTGASLTAGLRVAIGP